MISAQFTVQFSNLHDQRITIIYPTTMTSRSSSSLADQTDIKWRIHQANAASSSSQPSPTQDDGPNENVSYNAASQSQVLLRRKHERGNSSVGRSQPLMDGIVDENQQTGDPPTADTSTSTVARSPNSPGRGGHDSQNEESDDEEEPSSGRRKRRRVNAGDEDGDDNIRDIKPDVRQPDDEEEEQARTQEPASQADNDASNDAARDAGGFLPGSIVRVALTNFVTYDYTEFFPGPHLNMIIGPNGTGKSTIVCAIALGLGWKPAVLGRAKDVASFVKQGCNEGWIELELKAPKDTTQNIIIRRSLERNNNASEWRINGKKVTAKDIASAVGQFNINVDNLCCFLPQDKVADFAKLDQPRLLVETQRAAGNAHLSAWHERLVVLDKQLRDINSVLTTEQDQQNNLEQRNEVLGNDVRRFEQRERIREEIEVLKLQLPMSAFFEAKEKYKGLKEVRKQRMQELAEMKRVNEPLEIKVQEMKDRKTKLDRNRNKFQDKINAVGKDLQRALERIDKADSETSDLQNSLESLKQRETEHQKLVAQLRSQVSDLTKQVEKEPEESDTADLDQKLRKCRNAIREVESRVRDLKEERSEVSAEADQLHRREDDTRLKLKRLDDVRSRRLEALRMADNDCYKAVMWLRENRKRFDKAVFEPIMLEINVRDARYAAQVESCLNWQVLRTFVCETRADYDRLTSELIDKQGLKLNVAEFQGGRTIAQYEDGRPLSLQQIRDLGFDDYILNLIEGPGTVLEWLCSSVFLHVIPTALSDSSVNPEQVERSKQIKRYISGRSNHTISFSQYGRGLPQTLSRDIKPVRSLSQSINQSEKDSLDATMIEIAGKIKDVQARVGELNAQIEAEKEKIESQQEKRRELEGQRIDAQKARKQWERAKIDLDGKRKRLNAELSRPSVEEDRKRINRSISVLTEKRAKQVLEMRDQLRAQWEHRRALDIAVLAELQHGVNYRAWKTLLQSKDHKYKEAEKAVAKADDEFQSAKAEAAVLRRDAQSKLDAAPEAISNKFSEITKEREESGEALPTVADLESELTTKQGAFDMAQGVPAAVVEAYKKRDAEIKKLEESITQKRREAQRLDGAIKQTYNQWYPALTTLVESISSKFSAAFARIGCAGEVGIAQKEGHYDEWGIEIRVKFRDQGSLQVLTAQRQSGGERSLSTILYLMSLTELSRSPFSLVDEINQGMDQHRERAVHDQMVEVTCKPDAAQYFLITPKLLSDLKYHDMMKILIINNGEWLPEKIDPAKYARKRLRAGGAGGANGSALQQAPQAAPVGA